MGQLSIRLSVFAAVLACSSAAWGQQFSAGITTPYRVKPNITYLTANNFEAKLDVYARSDVTTPQPTLVWIHGGGWTGSAACRIGWRWRPACRP